MGWEKTGLLANLLRQWHDTWCTFFVTGTSPAGLGARSSAAEPGLWSLQVQPLQLGLPVQAEVVHALLLAGGTLHVPREGAHAQGPLPEHALTACD